ncbi:hypothetical protein ACFLX9_03285 [Chloroflexota bacterium]
MLAVSSYWDYLYGHNSRFRHGDFRNSVAELNEHQAVRDAVFELFSFAQANADVIKGGQAQGGSFHYQFNVKNRTQTLFTVDANGYVSVSLGGFVGFSPLVPGRLVVKLRSTLARIPGFESFAKNYPVRPGFLAAKTLVDPTVMKQFKCAILKFQKDAQAF